VFSLNRPLEELIETALFVDFFEFVAGRIIYLTIEDKPGLYFRISHLEKVSGKKISNKLINLAIKLSGGHGKLTILILEELISLTQIPKDSNQLVGYLLSKRPIRSALFSIWNSLNPSEQQYFIDKKQEPIFLERIGLCFDGKTTILIFDEFVKQEIYKNIKLKKESIVFQKNSNEIKIGNNIISDKLTSSEFKLLKKLVENKDKILTKDEIINAVWGDKTTTLGVTDQALDQLIFRLRKKIETNPNKPEYIITVKGRGFKLGE
jgi:DNA-binding winged helix-turn-helix (wHTH) protein